MKLISIFLYSLFTHFHYQDTTELYQMQFPEIDSGKTIDMAAYMGRKVIIIDFNAANPNRKQLKSLDTFYRSYKTQFAVIAVPVQNPGDSIQYEGLRMLLKDTLQLSYPVSDLAQRIEGATQHPLFEWLTSINVNLQLQDEIDDKGEMFVINDNDILYFALREDFVAKNVLMQCISSNEASGND